MADRPLSAPLPADLPEDWTDGQIVAPSGASVGLSEQHGYNYLMEAVNRAQEAVNAINESFDDISGRRTCRVVVGTSTAGWTQADCDYLCDGTDDQAELDAAVEAVRAKGGGEIAILGGTYHLSALWSVDSNQNENMSFAFSGEPGSTVLELAAGCRLRNNWATEFRPEFFEIHFFGVTFSSAEGTQRIDITTADVGFEGCRFLNVPIRSRGGIQGDVSRFLLRGNMMELSTESTDALISAIRGHVKFFVAGNVFRVKAAITFGRVAEISDTNVVFAQNYVVCDDPEGAQGYYLLMNGAVADNVIRSASIDVSGGSNCIGNYVENGSITAVEVPSRNKPAVCGNIVKNGSIHAVGFVTVSGNMVSAKADAPAVVLRTEDGLNVAAEHTPCVTGNTVTSGSIGIYLKNLDNPAKDPSQKKALVSDNRISGCATSIQIESDWSQCMITGNMLDSSVVDGGTGNIVRLNSDDAGGGGGGTAGVSSFNGRAGAVVPASGDYTAAMVGSIPSGDVTAVKSVTQAQYDALSTKDPATLYLIRG